MIDPSLTLQCSDDMLSHQVRVTLYTDDGTASVEMVMDTGPFFYRLKRAWRYLFGREPCGVADVVLSEERVTVLRQFLCAHEFDGWQRKAVWRAPESRL